jgi:predicted transcriptional regulator
MRLALRVYSLHLQSKDEVLYTYQRTFKFLSEMLTVEEFQTLTFTNVNMLIDQIFQTKKTPQNDGKERVSLRQFIFDALMMPYKITDRSYTLLNPHIALDG